ncbi:MAG: hypothetical protein R3C49_23655 [Planctomycetaceae bacterium]
MAAGYQYSNGGLLRVDYFGIPNVCLGNAIWANGIEFFHMNRSWAFPAFTHCWR